MISRVTGGTPSNIDGTLRSQLGKATFWLLNPAGVMFGPNARLDVPAAFYVGTADEVRFSDGAKFSASDPASSRLTVARPEAFGFLQSNPAGIAVNGSMVQTPAEQTLALAGGEVRVTGGKIASSGGRVNLTATGGPGTVQAATGVPAVPARGAVRLAQGAQLDTSGNGGGQIIIRGGQINVTAGAAVLADNTGAQKSAGGIAVGGNTVHVAASTISSSTYGRGQAGAVTVTAQDTLQISNGGRIRSATFAQGRAGGVIIQAGDLNVVGNGGRIFTGISSDARPGSSGAAGNITVTGGKIEMRDGGQVSATTRSTQGNAGTITLQADRLLISRGGASGVFRFTGIGSQAVSGDGDAGMVAVTGREIEVRDGGEISSTTFAGGDAGTVLIQAHQLRVSGRQAQITSSVESQSLGQGGQVRVTARDLEVRRGGRIQSLTFARGKAGTITVQADRLLVAGTDELGFFALIASAAEHGSAGPAGSIGVTARQLEVHNGGQIATSTSGQGKAGQILIQADRILLDGQGDGQSGIVSRALPGSTGAGGTIDVHGGDIRLADRGIITTQSASLQHAGAVTVTADGGLSLTGGTQIASSASQADAGPITIITPSTLRLSESSVTTEAQQGGGGQITLTAGRLIDLVNSQITSSTFGLNAMQSAGNITIDPQFLVLDRSRILARANRGRGGNIRITAGQIIRSPDSPIDASSERGISGQVDIRAPDQEIGGMLAPLLSAFLDASALLPTACAARLGGAASSLTAAGLTHEGL